MSEPNHDMDAAPRDRAILVLCDWGGSVGREWHVARMDRHDVGWMCATSQTGAELCPLPIAWAELPPIT